MLNTQNPGQGDRSAEIINKNMLNYKLPLLVLRGDDPLK